MSICIHNQVIRIQSPKTNGDMTYLIFCWRTSTSMPHSYSTLTVEACLQGWCNIFIIDFRWGWQVTRHWNLPGMKYFQISHGGPTQVFFFVSILVVTDCTNIQPCAFCSGRCSLKGDTLRKTEQTWPKGLSQNALNQDLKTFGCQSGPSNYDWYNHKITVYNSIRESTFWGFSWRTGHWYHTQDISIKLGHPTMSPNNIRPISPPWKLTRPRKKTKKTTILKGKNHFPTINFQGILLVS